MINVDWSVDFAMGLTLTTDTSAGRSLRFYLSMFVSEICKQISNISNHGVKSINQTEKSNIKL